MRFLVDECLSPALVRAANDLGYEAYHVAWRGWSGKSDVELLTNVLEENLVFVTNNRDDFAELVGDTELHPGLIVILPSVRRYEQVRLFEVAVIAANKLGSTINKILEVDLDGSVVVSDIPPL